MNLELIQNIFIERLLSVRCDINSRNVIINIISYSPSKIVSSSNHGNKLRSTVRCGDCNEKGVA
jgi:hypothetical protein